MALVHVHLAALLAHAYIYTMYSTNIVYQVMNIIKLFITEHLTMNDIHVYNYNMSLNSCRYMKDTHEDAVILHLLVGYYVSVVAKSSVSTITVWPDCR